MASPLEVAAPSALDGLRAELGARLVEARARSVRLGRPVLASAAVELRWELDVAACIFQSRVAEERYFVFEQPERDGFVLGCLGAVSVVEGIPAPDRFGGAASLCAEIARDRVEGESEDLLASGPVWVGGFAFAPSGGRSPEWASFPPTMLVLPALSIVRRDGRVVATLNALCRADDDPARLGRAAVARIESLRSSPIPPGDPDPLVSFEIASVEPPETYEQAIVEARERIRAGELEKVVLAREVRVEAPTPFPVASIFDTLRSVYPSCFCFCVGTPEAAFVGASPELLVRREGARVSSVAMAGSTRRSADPAVDDHLGQRLLQSDKDREEHRIVARRIERALEPLSVWVASADEPSLVKVANIQHLATPVRAQLAEPLSAVELAGALHPTPAVGGEPWSVARAIIPLERLDRGWYAGAVGWMDGAEDGEFCVALRCALLQSRVAHCYAGVGVVADSDPETELEETEVKLQAVLPALTGS